MTRTKLAKFLQLFVHNVHLGFEPDVHVSLCGPGLFVYPFPRPYQLSSSRTGTVPSLLGSPASSTKLGTNPVLSI